MPSRWNVGVAGYPEMHEEAASPEADIACLKAKVDAGAEYVVTQLFYDNARFFDYVRRCREAGITVPIIPGIKPLSTVRHLTLLPQTFGCHIPEELGREVLRHKDDPKAVREVGTEWVTPGGPSPRAGSWSKRASPSCTTTRWARPTTSSRLQKRYFKRHE